ncbi:MAG: hypothetical protein RL115_1323 [Bacteroidota bacterium]|jgi:hypothetical protein
MNYAQGIEYMKKLATDLKERGEENGSFKVGNLEIYYPGFKEHGDYKLTKDGYILKHIDIVKEIHQHTTKENFEEVSIFLEDVYVNGLNATAQFIDEEFKQKLYWRTLQEEINYPQPKRAGRKLSFMRYYEAALAAIDYVEIEKVMERTNHRAQGRPPLFNLKELRRPKFYIEYISRRTDKSWPI